MIATFRQDTKRSTATPKDLKVQLQKMVDDRMLNLGVSPAWKSIPDKSFQQALAKIKQQAILDQKVGFFSKQPIQLIANTTSFLDYSKLHTNSQTNLEGGITKYQNLNDSPGRQ